MAAVALRGPHGGKRSRQSPPHFARFVRRRRCGDANRCRFGSVPLLEDVVPIADSQGTIVDSEETPSLQLRRGVTGLIRGRSRLAPLRARS